MEPKKLLIMGSDLGSLDMALEGKKRGLYVITTESTYSLLILWTRLPPRRRLMRRG